MPSMKGSSHSIASSTLGMRTNLPLAAKGHRRLSVLKAHPRGTHCGALKDLSALVFNTHCTKTWHVSRNTNRRKEDRKHCHENRPPTAGRKTKKSEWGLSSCKPPTTPCSPTLLGSPTGVLHYVVHLNLRILSTGSSARQSQPRYHQDHKLKY